MVRWSLGNKASSQASGAVNPTQAIEGPEPSDYGTAIEEHGEPVEESVSEEAISQEFNNIVPKLTQPGPFTPAFADIQCTRKIKG